VKRILFRADAKPSIGTGDLMSLIHLSRYLERDGWETHFMIRDYKAGVDLAAKYGIRKIQVMDGNLTIQGEVDEINKYIEEQRIDVVFFEITERKLTEYDGITSRVIKACVSFDGVVPDKTDLVVNWDVEAHTRFNTARYPDTMFLLGPEYVILPSEFDLTKIQKRMYKESPERLLVAMGGADEFNITQKLVDVLKRNKIKLKVHVIVGAGYGYLETLHNSLKNSGLQYEIKQNITNMFNEYLECDVAVGAGGLTSYELIAAATPALLIAAYEHQVARCVYFDSQGWAKFMGFREFDGDRLSFLINHPPVSRGGYRFNTRAIVDAVNGLAKRYCS